MSAETIHGETGTWTTETYFASASSTNPNVWQRETVTTEPNGAISTVYRNFIGQPLISDLFDGTTHTIISDQYNEDGQLTAEAQPSAFTGVTTPYTAGSEGFLTVAMNNTGLIDVFAYYSTTTAPDYDTTTAPPLGATALGGGVEGYMQATGVQQGASGTRNWQTSVNYISYTIDGATAYYTFDSTVYQADQTGDAPLPATSNVSRTSYRYTFYTSGVTGPVVQSETTILPAVSTAEKGTGTSATTIAWFDMHGYQTWSQDANGFLSLNQYDATTGLLMETVANVNTSSLPSKITGGLDSVTKPYLPGTTTYAATPSGDSSNLNATTDFSYDTLLRLSQSLGPVHAIVTSSGSTVSAHRPPGPSTTTSTTPRLPRRATTTRPPLLLLW